jgi:hypothetical protein
MAEYERTDKQVMMLDKLTREQIDALPSSRVLNTHVPFRYIPKQAGEVSEVIYYVGIM